MVKWLKQFGNLTMQPATRNGLAFWVLGFGLLHLVYGVVMWMRYER